MRCSKCGADNREGRKFCAKCATPLARLCPQCGTSNEPGEDFCGECAAPLGQPSAPSPNKAGDAPILVAETPASENLDGERKTVTMLFADIKGSMELIEDLDPEEARAIVDPALQLMMEAVQRYGAMSPNLPVTESSRSSALRSRMKTIRSARYSPHFVCRRSSNATRTASALKAACRSRREWE